MTYRNVVSAVVRALASEVINSAGGCSFEPRVQAARVPGAISGSAERLLDDALVRRIMRETLTPLQYAALAGQYSTDGPSKHAGVNLLIRSVESPAPVRFVECACWTWAYPKKDGKDGKRSIAVLPAGWYQMDNWSDDPVPVKTQERWRRDIRKALKQAVDQALIEAHEILAAEGLVAGEAA
jgi:hypothetical protein